MFACLRACEDCRCWYAVSKLIKESFIFKQFTGAALVASALVLPFLVVAPASAATLPSTDTLYAISCDHGAELFSVDTDTADMTLIGSTTLANDCAGQGAFDPITGTAYYISWGNVGGLAAIDLTTGAATVTPITGDSVDYGVPDSLAIGRDGSAWVIAGYDLFSIDLSTGATTLVANLTDHCFYSFSVDPSTGKFYVIECGSGEAFELTVADGTLTSIGTITLTDNTYALQIDTSGRWWFQQDDSSLWSTAIPNGVMTPESEGNLVDSANSTAPYSESLLLTYEDDVPADHVIAADPELAATGAEVVPGLLAAGTLAVLGTVLTMVAIRRRRRA